MKPNTISSTNEAVIDPWCQTFTGKRYYADNPEPQIIDIADIAHSLATKNRFNGHVRGFLSVAQHAVLVSKMVPLRDALWGLHHDDPEAYLPDVQSPFKHSMPMYRIEYRRVEKLFMEAIQSKFNLPAVCPGSVKEADLRMRATEAIQYMGDMSGWDLAEPYDIEIWQWSWQRAEKEFLRRHNYLVGK